MIKINKHMCDELSLKAKDNYRSRMNLNFHSCASDPLQRFLNALEPDSYIQPHKHSEPLKTELFLLLKGSVLVLEYDDRGEIVDAVVLDYSIGNYGVEIDAGKWHSCIALESGTVFYEVKSGPYCPPDKVMADWAPEEGSDKAIEFMKNLINKYGK